MQLSKLDPDWQAAYLHGISTMPGLSRKGKSQQDQLICPCCLNQVDKTPAPLCSNSKQLQFLGFGFPLFYVFMKYCIILLLMSTATYTAIELYWATIDSEKLCEQLQFGCSSFMVQTAKITPVVNNGEVVARSFSFVMQLMMLIYIRDLITKTKKYYNERTLSLSEFSIIVTGLPKKGGAKKNLQSFLQNCFDTPHKAYCITILPEYDEYYAMQEQKERVIQKMKLAIRESHSGDSLDEQLMEVQCQMHIYCNKQLRLEEIDQCPTEKLIFSCATQAEKNLILSNFDDISQEKKREAFQVAPEDQCDIWFADAPQPKEINWEHINYPDNSRVGRMIVGWLLTSAFLLSVTVVFFFLLSQKSALISESFAHEAAVEEASYFTGLFMVYLTLTCVILFNKFVMGFVMHRICEFERHSTSDLQEFHFAIKYSVGLFFTTALMTLAVEDFRFANFYDRPYGVIEEETIMFIMNSLFVPFIWLVNPWHLVQSFRRRLNKGRKDLTQKDANKLMENVQYNMGKRYAEVIEIMWFTFLYSSLIPLGTFLSIIGLSLYYWIDKYNLLRRSSISSNIAGELSIFAMKLLDFTLLFKPLGQLIFDSQIRDSYCLSSIVMCAIAILYLVLPIDDFLNYFHPEKYKLEEKTFDEAQRLIKDTYQTLHPIFKLKKQNQNKMYQSFHKSESNIERIDIIQMQSVVGQPETIASKDVTNILQALFQRHDQFTAKLVRHSSRFYK